MINRHVLISGAGSGVGQAIAKLFADNNYRILLIGRNIDKLEDTRSQMLRPDVHQCISCDIRNPTEIRTALQQSSIDSLYGLVANAGIAKANFYGDKDSWQELMDINLTGSYNTVQESLPYLKKNPAAFRNIVFISSVLAQVGVPGWTAYCASKAAILGLMRSLAVELAPENILVNAICPGFVDTSMAQGAFDDMALALDVSKDEAFQIAMRDVPLGKMSTPSEIARLAEFLVSEKQISITGQSININNGTFMP